MKINFKPQNLFANLDAAIIDQAKSDLIRVNNRSCLQAAEYFFLDGAGFDEKYPKTFTHLCARNGIDPDRAAKGIWGQLSIDQKNRILRLLKEAGLSPK